MDESGGILMHVFSVVSVGVAAACATAPLTTLCCRILCAGGLIFVVLVQVKPSTMEIIDKDAHSTTLESATQCNHHDNPMDVCRNWNLHCIMSHNCRSHCEELDRHLESGSDKEMEEEEEVELVAALAAVASLSQTSRNFKWQDAPLNWGKHVEKLQHAGEFDSMHRMLLETFTKLKNVFGDCIKLDAAKSSNSASDASDCICPELIMHIGLQTLAGGKFADVRDAAGVSRASACHCRDIFLDAVLNAHELAIMPPSPEELPKLAAKSTCEAIKGCIGCINGLSARIIQPFGVGNPRAHWSGHHHCFGLNV